MKISYISAGMAAVAAALCGRYYFVAAENARLRIEAIEFQQLAESIQPQLDAKKQQLRIQQDKLNKGSAISQNVGPAVLADIRSAAEKNNNLKLKDLLAKYGVREVGGPATPGGSGAPNPAGAAGGTRKGGN